MRFGSVCSGIEAASVAWNPLGWEAAWFSEIEPFPCALLAHHYPNVPNLGDMTTIAPRILSGEVEAPDILCGGTPCQAFSVAGLRKSLDDARGNLSLVFCELANAIDSARSLRGLPPSIIFWENVPLTIQKRSCVRKLTPVECERLQGFPDNYTRIPYRGKPESECPDGPRYKAIGNSWAVPVVRWIGKRINKALGR